MNLIEDTLNKPGQHETKHAYWQKMGCNIIRCRLPFGDYVAVPSVAVDTKRDIYEIAGNLTTEHVRFRNECIRAKDAGCQLVILIENLDGVSSIDDLENWVESYRHFRMRNGKQRVSGKYLSLTMRTMTKKYGVRFEFCTPNDAGRRVIEIIEGGGTDGISS